MGSKKSKQSGGKAVKITPKKDLSKKDYEFLMKQTGLSKDEIKSIHEQFMANNPDGMLDRREFVRLYEKLRPEPPEVLNEISEFAFRAFDADNNGSISFSEFLVAYAMTSRGDQRHKLEYAFEVYDADNNGYLDSGELRTVIYGMLDMLGADKHGHDINQLVNEAVKKLDANHDGKIRKDEFINGLLSDVALRSLMSPFN